MNIPENNSQPAPFVEGNDSDGYCDNSEDELKIVIDYPSPRKRTKLNLDEADKQIIESVSESIEKTIEEKQAKTQLNATHVKCLLKEMLTNEQVLALVKQYENPEENREPAIVFEPKLTRAKAKELLSTNSPPGPIIPLSTTKTSPEVQLLFSEELQEDSSGDEYIPESEDDRESTNYDDSNPPSVSSGPPSTPTKDSVSTQTNWSEDGIFKVPPTKSLEEDKNEENIALRTRSKLCLSSTPLEVIEGSFIPPDITTDMYDMDCDDDDWAEFLKTFTQPLEEVTKAPDDEDHDPEYNILADEAIDEVDKEELREDKAVKVSRRELQALMSELCEYVDFFDTNISDQTRNSKTEQDEIEQANFTEESQQNKEVNQNMEASANDTQNGEPDVLFDSNQIALLEQQLRQHVQMLTSNYLLTFNHPYLSELAPTFKESLLNFKYLAEGKTDSIFRIQNLEGALALIEKWEYKLSNQKEGETIIQHFEVTSRKAKEWHHKYGTHYYMKFPPEFMETVSRSEVFLYPHLLPPMPFYTTDTFQNTHIYTPSELQLIAMGLEQFMPMLSTMKEHLTKLKEVNLKHVASYIQKYTLGGVSTFMKVYKCILKYKSTRAEPNPIKHYFEHKQAPPTIHHVLPLDVLNILPPYKRDVSSMPSDWMDYIGANQQSLNLCNDGIPQGENKEQILQYQLSPIQPFVQTPKPSSSLPAINIFPTVLIANISPQSLSVTPIKRIFPKKTPIKQEKPTIPSRKRYDLQDKFSAIIANRIPLEKLISNVAKALGYKVKYGKEYLAHFEHIGDRENDEDMLPGMPSLLSTPVKLSFDGGDTSKNSGVDNGGDDVLGIKNDKIFSRNSSFISLPSSSTDEFEDVAVPGADKTEDAAIKMDTNERDNIEDINALMKASSTIKTTRKEPSGAEKKRNRIRREFVCNLRMATPESQVDIEKRQEHFALSYYKKLQEVLQVDDYHKVMEVLTNVDESKTDAVDIYNKIIQVLYPKYKDLAEEFLLFLNDVQAHAVGKLVPYYLIKNMSLFLQKVDLYFQDKPTQAKRIFKTLTDLGEQQDITIDKIKSAILPLLKGNSYLTDLFLQNFITERPPDSLIADKYETIEITKETTECVENEELYESIIIPETEDSYGNTSCVCECHEKSEEPESIAKKKHCIPCGTKYLQGKIFIQTAKGLRPATVRFLTNTKKDHNTRLNNECSPQKKRSESTSKRSTSPVKECHDESKHTKKKEDEGGGKKKTRAKSPKKPAKKSPPKACEKTKNDKKISGVAHKNKSVPICDKKADSSSVNSSSKANKSKTKSPLKEAPQNKCRRSRKSSKTIEKNEAIPGPSSSQPQKRPAEEPLELDLNSSLETVVDSVAEAKFSSAESESEFFEESSQANTISDHEDSSSSSVTFEDVIDIGEISVTMNDTTPWTREEDKLLLETFQRESIKENVFRTLADCLPNRTTMQIKCRFQRLMSLIQEMNAEEQE